MNSKMRVLLVLLLIFVSMTKIKASRDEEVMKLRQAAVTIQDRIGANWHAGFNSFGRSAIAEFEVNQDGSIANLKMKQKSGSYDYDVNCLKTIINSAPFSQMSEWIKIEFNFDFNLYNKTLLSKKNLAKAIYDPANPYSLELIEKSIPVIKRSDRQETPAHDLRQATSEIEPTKESKHALTSSDMKKIAQFKLGFPLDCQLNKDCFVTIYPSHAGEAKDFTCGRLSAAGVKGTAFSLRNNKQILDPGVSVLAVAKGKVINVDDGFADDYEFSGKEVALDGCGNSLTIKHDDDFTSSYCHLLKDSIKVKVGQRVEKATVIAKLGASGVTNQPQLHLGLKYKSIAIDPFTATDLSTPCSSAGKNYKKSMWDKLISYKSTGLRSLGVAPLEPSLKDIWSNKFATNSIAADADALIFWVHLFGQKIGNVEEVKIIQPDGSLFLSRNTLIEKNYRDALQFAGRYKSENDFQKGLWKVHYKVLYEDEVLVDADYDFVVK